MTYVLYALALSWAGLVLYMLLLLARQRALSRRLTRMEADHV